MLTTLFRVAMRWYPPDHRAMFGAEIEDTFHRAAADAWSKGTSAGCAFCVREAVGLVRESLRLRLSAPGPHPEAWWWSLEAPTLAVVLYSLTVDASHDLGLWGFFFPATYLVAATLAVVSAWVVGRTCSILRPPRRYGALVAAAVIAVAIVPAAVRATEDVQAHSLVMRQGAVGFTIPGVTVASDDAATVRPRIPGLTFTRVVRSAEGTVLTLRHHRSLSAPPYLAIGALLTGLLAFVSRIAHRRAGA